MREDVMVLLEWISLVIRSQTTSVFNEPLPLDWRERATADEIARIREITLPVILAFGRVFAG